MKTNIYLLMARQVGLTAFKNKAVSILVFIIASLLAYAAYSGFKIQNTHDAIRLKYEQQVRENWENMPDKHPHRMAHYGYLAFRPKYPLSFFDFGVESYTGNAVFLEAHKQNSINFSEASFSSGLLRFGEISMAMILQILLPLLVFFLGFNTIAAERENNTLKLLISQGAGWKEIIFGKALGLFAIILVIFLPAVFIALFFLVIYPNAQLSTDIVFRFFWIVFSYGMYFGILTLVAVIISAISKTSKSALVLLIGTWLIFCIVVPRATQAIGNRLYPSPSKVAFETAVEKELLEKGDSHDPNDPYFNELKDSVLQLYKVKTIEELPFNYSGFQMKEGEKISSEIYNRHHAALMTIYQQQNSVSRFTSFLNPYLAIKNLSMALCGTDFNAYMDFMEQTETYRYNLAQYMNNLQIKLISNKKPGDQDQPHQISKDYWAVFPDFEYEPVTQGVVLADEIASVIALLLWMISLILLVNKLSGKIKAI